MLGLAGTDPAVLLAWYDAIVAGVSALTAANAPADGGSVVSRAAGGNGQVPAAAAAAFGELRASLVAAIERPGASSLLAVAAQTAGLAVGEVVSNAAVMLFGGIETTEGMICNAVRHLLASPDQVHDLNADRSLLDGAVDESLRLEPAAAVVDRYATASARLGEADIPAATWSSSRWPGPTGTRPCSRNRTGSTSAGPTRGRTWASRWARTSASAPSWPGWRRAPPITALLDRLPGLRLDPEQLAAPRGLVFRKPPALHVRWDPSAT